MVMPIFRAGGFMGIFAVGVVLFIARGHIYRLLYRIGSGGFLGGFGGEFVWDF